MKYLSLLIIISLNVSFGQEAIFNSNLNVKAKDTRIISGIEKDGTILLNVFEGEGLNKFYLINDKRQVIQYYDIISRENLRHVIHLSAVEGSFYVYTYQKGYHTSPTGLRQDLNYIQYIRFSNDGSSRPVLTNLTGISPYEKPMVSMQRNDTLFIVTFNDKNFTASVNIISPEQKVTRKEFSFQDRKTFKRFYRENYFPVKAQSENSFETFLHKNKVYLSGKEVVFISDDDEGNVSRVDGNPKASLDRNVVFVTTLNLETNKASVEELKLNYSIKAEHNSYLYKNYLFVVGSTRLDFSLSVYDYPSLVEKRKFSQGEIESKMDWSKIIVSNNKTMTGSVLKSDFNALMKKGTPVIGIHDADTLCLVLGLFTFEDDRLKLSYSSIAGMTSYGFYEVRGGGSAQPINNSMTSTDFPTIVKPIQLPFYFVPAAARPIVERRIYGNLVIDINNLSLISGLRPNSIYDVLELQTEKMREKKRSMAVFSFENDKFVFISYINKEDETDDSFIIIEKYAR